MIREDQRRTLPPIPEGYTVPASWKDEFATSPLLVYAGNYWPAQIPLFGRIADEAASAGGRFMLVVKNCAQIEALCREHPVLWREPFSENSEALAFLAAKAAGLVVSYSDNSDSMPWVRTSFPSKLIEYVHLGLPILIYAPADTAVAEWAYSRRYSDFSTPETQGAVRAFVMAVKVREAWQKKAEASLQIAKHEFAPDRIHEVFERNLLRTSG
jgi:hypothetical protein